MTYDSPSPSSPPPRINKIGAVGTSKDKATYVIEVTSEVRIDLQGCLEAVVTSESAKRAYNK